MRVYPIGAVTRGLEGKQLAEMAEQAEAGCVAFSDDGKCVMNAELYRRAMEYALPFGVPVISHAEDCAPRATAGRCTRGSSPPSSGLPGQPAAAEDVMVARDIVLAELTGAHLHIAHVSTAGAVRLVRDAKARGVRVTAEVTPHHLLLTDEAVRELRHQRQDGAAAPRQARRRGAARRPSPTAPSTASPPTTRRTRSPRRRASSRRRPTASSGLETAVPLLLDRLVRAGRPATSPTLVDAAQRRDPARLLNLPGGSLAAGRAGRRHDPRSRAGLDGRPGRGSARASRNTPVRRRVTGAGAPWMTMVGGVKVAS